MHQKEQVVNNKTAKGEIIIIWKKDFKENNILEEEIGIYGFVFSVPTI